MKQKQPIWKKTAAATLALAMLAGGTTGMMASAHSKHESDDKGDWGYKGKGRSNIQIRLNFRDLNEKEWKWAFEHIIRLASKGVFSGYEDGSFKPRNNITRIEAIVAAVRLLGLEDEAKKPENMNAKLNFKDAGLLKKKYPWAVGYVEVALKNDLFAETDNVIQPQKPADRLWATILLVKAMKLEDEAKAKMDAELQFRDADKIPAGSVGYVAVAVEKNLISGYNDGTFRPDRPVTRAELAALLDRVDQQLPDQDQGAQAITGTIQAVANGTVTVKKADGTTVTVPLDANVFIFRNDVKSQPSALQVGDEVLVRTFEGKAVFIEVTKMASQTPVQTTDTGTVSAITLDANGKIATLSITKSVNGTTNVVVYNVNPNVTITGGSGVLAPNMNVTVTLENNVVKAIQIQS